MRYRGGTRGSYASRLHYFSEWISDGARRGLLRDIAPELGGEEDTRPLRFMTEHRKSYVALADDRVFDQIATMEHGLDGRPRGRGTVEFHAETRTTARDAETRLGERHSPPDRQNLELWMESICGR